MIQIALVTFNAKYIHPSLGLRSLLANLGEWKSQAKLFEFNPDVMTTDAVEKILEGNPRIVCVGVYLWNLARTQELLAQIKVLRPEIYVIAGGPEVSFGARALPGHMSSCATRAGRDES